MTDNLTSAELSDLADTLVEALTASSGRDANRGIRATVEAVHAEEGLMEVVIDGDDVSTLLPMESGAIGAKPGDRAYVKLEGREAYVDSFRVTDATDRLSLLEERTEGIEEEVGELGPAVENVVEIVDTVGPALDAAKAEMDAVRSDVDAVKGEMGEAAAAADAASKRADAAQAAADELRKTAATKAEVERSVDEAKGEVMQSVAASYVDKATGATLATKSELQQTASGIRSEVAEAYATKESTEGLASRSELEQTASSIRAEVARGYVDKATGETLATKSELTQTAGSIRLEVSQTYTAKADAVTATKLQFYLSTSQTQLTGGSWSDTAPAPQQGRYIWQRSVETKGDGSTVTGPAVCVTGNTGPQGAQGQQGQQGAQGVGVRTTAVSYQASTSGTTAPTGAWAAQPPSVAPGSYLWTRTVTTMTDGTSSTSYSVARQGGDGATGKGVTAVVEEWYLSTSATSQAGGSWSSAQPALAAGCYLWNRQRLTWTDGTTTHTTPQRYNAVDGIKSDLDAFRADAATTYATKASLTTTADAIRSEVSRDYATKASTATLAEKSYVDQKADSITQSVSQTYLKTADAASLYAGKTEVKQTTDAIRLTAEESLRKVEGLEVGGTNIATGSKLCTDMCAPKNGATAAGTDAYPGFNKVVVSRPSSGMVDPIQMLLPRTEPAPRSGDSLTVSFDAATHDGKPVDLLCYMWSDRNDGSNTAKATVNSSGVSTSSSDGANAITVDSASYKRYWYTVTYKADAERAPAVYIGRLLANKASGHGDGPVYICRVKVEQGNLPTDWSPAPEDADATYATKAALSVESDRIAGVVSEQAGLAKRVSTVEQKSDSFEIRFDNLTVGGANLILNSNFDNGMKNWNKDGDVTWSVVDVDVPDLPSPPKKGLLGTAANGKAGRIYQWVGSGVVKGNTYALSFLAKSESGSPMTLRSAVADSFNTEDHTVPTTWTRFTRTFTAASTGSLTFRPLGVNTGERKVVITNVKLEKGNMATDWSPAPEDVDAGIDDAAKTATNFLRMDSGGLTVGDLRASTTGKNVHIDQDSVDIRNGSTVLATFGAERIGLGMNSTNAGVEFIGGKGRMEYHTGSGLTIEGDTGIDLRINGATERNPYVTLVNKGTAASPSYSLALSADTVSLFDAHAAQGGVYDVQFSKPAYHLINLLNRFDTEWYQTKFASNLNALWNSGLFCWSPTTVGIPETNTYGMGICISNQQADSSSNWAYQFAKTTADTGTVWVRQSINTGGWTAWRAIGGPPATPHIRTWSAVTTVTAADGQWITAANLGLTTASGHLARAWDRSKGDVLFAQSGDTAAQSAGVIRAQPANDLKNVWVQFSKAPTAGSFRFSLCAIQMP
ncbi:carbohydrate binding domain-containing protein [Caniella muris]|uniref:carbohydrate binding domain-containing protein n=1 Tax=Caniella muris TaxID=2941502 RepID=UPI00203C3CD6|nr:carbohydrate binding domain-containing protein [Caniella muris]